MSEHNLADTFTVDPASLAEYAKAQADAEKDEELKKRLKLHDTHEDPKGTALWDAHAADFDAPEGDLVKQVSRDEVARQHEFGTDYSPSPKSVMYRPKPTPEGAAPPSIVYPKATSTGGPQLPPGSTPDNRPFDIPSLFTKTVTPAHEASLVSPARESQLHEAQDEGMHLGAHQGYVEAKAEDQKAQAQQEIANEDLRVKQQQQQLAQQRFAEAQQNLEKVQKTYDDLAKQPEINPDRWWSSQSTGAKIGYAFAAALAGFGQGWNHDNGPNPVIQHIKEAIQQDVAAQADSYHRKEKLADVKNTLYAQAYGLTGDRNQALILANQLGVEAQIRKAQAVEHSSASPVVKANAANTVNQLQLSQIEEDIKHHPMVQASATGGFSQADLIKRVRELTDKGDLNGKPMPPYEAYRRALAELGASDGRPLFDISKTPRGRTDATAGALDETLKAGQEIKSAGEDASTWASPVVRFHLENWFQNTDGATRLLQNQQYNLGVKSAVRNVMKLRGGTEDLAKASAPYLIERYDSPERIARKIDAFHRFAETGTHTLPVEDLPEPPNEQDVGSSEGFVED